MNKSKEFNRRFLILGDRIKINMYTDSELKKKILKCDQRKKLQGIWGTIGWRDKRKNFDLDIEYSKTGNTDSLKRDTLTSDIVDELQSVNDAIINPKEDLIKR